MKMLLRYVDDEGGDEPKSKALNLAVYNPTLTCSHEVWIMTKMNKILNTQS